ncbi:MAG: metallophosphoesterase [Polyangiaceae bacterium]|nr:metallophosphoesterase [Polyangiaceae bacterium]
MSRYSVQSVKGASRRGGLTSAWALLAAGAFTALVGCQSRPAEERARRDLEVGRASGHGVSLRVSDGLAVVREIRVENGEGRLWLWSSAPSWELTLRRMDSAPERLRLRLSNIPKDAALEVVSGAAQVVKLPPTDPSAPPSAELSFQLTTQDAELRLRLASPASKVEGPFAFAVLSDIQEAIDSVQDIFRRVNLEPVVFLLGAGDLTQQGTHEQLTRFQRELQGLSVPYYTTLGNHELGQSPSLWHDYFGRGSFHFGYRGVAFTLLDSGSATLDPIVYDWLDGWLKAASGRVHVVAMHIPPLDPIGVRNGAFASRNEAAKLLVKLAEGHVDLTLYGHIHSLYDFENAGIPAYISGGGGAIPERFDEIGRHFLVVDVDPAQGVTGVRAVRVD